MTAARRLLTACALLCLVASPGTLAGPLRERLAEARAARENSRAKVLHDIAYGDDARQRFDVYLPSKLQASPILVMVHGGAWRFGDKTAVVQHKAERWLPHGFIFVSINYRLLPQADPLQQATDVARALAAVQRRATSWGGDPARIVLLGHSAGAHLVALLAAAPEIAYRQGTRPWLGSIALDSAALDIPAVMSGRHAGFYDEAFGDDAAYWQSVSPWHVLNNKAGPLLLVCSSRRPDQPCRQAERLAAKARTLGANVQIHAENLTHGEINERLGLPGTYTDAVEKFLAGLDPALALALRR